MPLLALLAIVAIFNTPPTFATPPAPPAAPQIQFNRDVRPILASACFACHGPDEKKREANLRLDTTQTPDSPFTKPDDQHLPAITPGDPSRSELYRRITHVDLDERMPPADHHHQLNATEIDTLKTWITQGATYQGHWSTIPLAQSEIPTTDQAHSIDAFVATTLSGGGLVFSPQADPHTLIRRLSFDLTGLPPTYKDVAAFTANPTEAAYLKLVDQYIASPHYGERLAMHWLDLVRYADTVGYHGDQNVNVSPYRDYVINSFNQNKPFSQFTIQQIAGDLLPATSSDQKLQNQIASGYNRLGMMSAEGGVQPKEYLAKYATDRVTNLAAVWLGTSFGCAECHDHKFDPFTTKDFYSLQAFFADIQEKGLYQGASKSGNFGSFVRIPKPQQATRLNILSKRAATLKKKFDAITPPNQDAFPDNIKAIAKNDPTKRKPDQIKELNDYYKKTAPDWAAAQSAYLASQKEHDTFQASIRSTLVTVAVEPRDIRILKRGNWMDDSGAIVAPAVPSVLDTLNTTARPTRLDLAKWLVSDRNPLGARVFVNRIWAMLFGRGISATLDDLGSQGAWPTHPNLLNHLAYQFQTDGGDIKSLIRSIVTSKTYRQSSAATPNLRKHDPDNLLFARQNIRRLDAEMIRDNALTLSSLLVKKIGGDSVRPYQPPGYYAHLNFPKRTYQPSTGSDQYRRGLYTHWQRQFLHPAMKAFDAPSRETCAAQRPTSNTPMAALVLLNDP